MNKDAKTFTSFGIEQLDRLSNKYGCSLITSVKYSKNGKLFKSKLKGLENIEGIYLLYLNSTTPIQEILDNYGKLSDIEYVQKNNVLHVDQISNDPMIGDEWFLTKINIENAWQVTRGKSNVLLAIIDTGIDYAHEDLQANIWVNPGEDLNHNGKVDSSDFNGIDDDQNGFVDDIQGWDFTDAPDIADNADYLVRDNDPMDEMGHGTSVAGLASAVAGNGKGISGIAPGCKLLNLRAGTAQGILQEDDVAAAVLYAVSMGARVINMSFGDVMYSNVFHDVIKFAYLNGCIVVASKGNSRTDKPHFPSDFDETISVGSTDRDDRLASFSNFGPKMDLVAPGVDLATTKRNNQYGSFSGTSASAPLVTGIIGLLLSQQPDLLPEQIRSILKISAVDLGIEGMDFLFGAGRLDARNLFSYLNGVVCHVFTPYFKSRGSSEVVLRGSAGGQKFLNYSLFYGIYPDSTNWRPIVIKVAHQIINDTLALWNVSQLPDNDYILRLVVNSTDGKSNEMHLRFLLDRTPPVISNFQYKEFIRGTQRQLFVFFETDDMTTGRVIWRYQGEDGFPRSNESVMKAQTHKIIIPLEQFSNSLEFCVEAINTARDTAKFSAAGDFFTFKPSVYDPPLWNVSLQKTQIPPLFLMPRLVSELNGNFIFGTMYDKDWGFQNIGMFDINGEVKQFEIHGIPRDVGDFDGDGLLDLLIGIGNKSAIYEKINTDPNSFEFKQVWVSPDEHWAARAINVMGESLPELVFRSNSDYVIYKSTGDNAYEKISTLPNPTKGENVPGIPRVETGDFDNDGKTELLMGDGDGDIYICEYQGNNLFTPTWQTRLDQFSAQDLIMSGDGDGDGTPEFMAGCYSNPSLNDEVNPAAKYWTFSIFHTTGDNQFEEVRKWNFSPFNSLKYFDSGCTSGDIDGDGRYEFYLGLYPNFYIIGFDNALKKYKVIWSSGPDSKNGDAKTISGNSQPVRSSRFVFLPPNRLFYTAEGGVQYLLKQPSELSGSWVVPLNFTVRIVKPNAVHLKWDTPFQESVIIQRLNPDSHEFKVIGTTASNLFIDSTVLSGNSYTYLLSDLNKAMNSIPVQVKPHSLPKIISTEFILPNQLLIKFDAEMENRLLNVTNYYVSPNTLKISSVEFTRGYTGVLVTFDLSSVVFGRYTIAIDRDFMDRQMAVIDPQYNSSSFVIPEPESEFYIVSAAALNPKTIVLDFSVPLDKQSAEDVSHYRIEPTGAIDRVKIDEIKSSRVTLFISQSHPVTTGQCIISVSGLKNQKGKIISQQLGNSISLFIQPETLADVFVYPNPCVATDGQGYVTFANITAEATIHILNQAGQIVQVLRSYDSGGNVEWHLDDKDGKQIASGIYLYYVEDKKKHIRGKLAVVR